MKDYKVYCYIFPSGKRYIGQTKTSLAVRAGPDGSNYSGCIRFWNAIQKYGWHNLKSKILADNLTKEEADILEVKFIDFYDTTNPDFGYNMKLGGHHSPPANGGYWAGKTLTEQHKENIRKSGIGRKHSEESKAKMRAKAGHPQSEETKKKLSDMNKGVYHPPADPEAARRHKSEATKKVWERRKALDKSTRKSLIGGRVRNNKSTEA